MSKWEAGLGREEEKANLIASRKISTEAQYPRDSVLCVCTSFQSLKRRNDEQCPKSGRRVAPSRQHLLLAPSNTPAALSDTSYSHYRRDEAPKASPSFPLIRAPFSSLSTTSRPQHPRQPFPPRPAPAHSHAKRRQSPSQVPRRRVRVRRGRQRRSQRERRRPRQGRP